MTSRTEAVKDTDLRRVQNLRTALAAAWAGEPLTATDLMALLPATRATALAVCEELTERGWLEELAESASGAQGGRPARRFGIRADTGIVIGVDAGANACRITALDLRGRTVASLEERLDAAADTATRLAAVRHHIDTVVRRASPASGALLGIGVGVPAPVGPDGASPPDNTFWERMNPRYVDTLADLAPIVAVENDANVAAIAEGAVGAGVGCASFACLLTGERLGAGIVSEGRLLRGHAGLAGELGILDLVEHVGSSIGFGVLAAEYAARSAAAGRPPLRADGTAARDAEGVLHSADEGDEEALRIVCVLGDRLARTVAVLAGVSGAERVIIGGALAPSSGPLLQQARASLRALEVAHCPSLVASQLGAQAVTMGAAQHALARVRDRALGLRPARG